MPDDLIRDLRKYAQDIHSKVGYHDYSCTMNLAADRLEKLEAIVKGLTEITKHL